MLKAALFVADPALGVIGQQCCNVGSCWRTMFRGVQGWRSGESTRLPSMWPGSASYVG